MKKGRIAPVLLAAGLFAAQPAWAVSVPWDDLTNAQQKSAYESLESEYDSLQSENESLRQENETLRQRLEAAQSTEENQASAGDGKTEQSDFGSSGGENTASETDASAGEGSESLKLKDVDTFLGDLAASFSKRQTEAAAYTSEQIASMSASELWAYRFSCAEAERDFYTAYQDAQFNSLNVLYLCGEYCGGLGKQYQAEEAWNSSQDESRASQLYTAGYYNRAYALVEFHDYYGLDLGDGYQSLKDAVTKMDAAGGEDTRNSGVDSAAVTKVQELLNGLGFLCGTPDGICGRQTTSCVERFQMMYGFTPADGLIDDELIAQMQDMTAKQGG